MRGQAPPLAPGLRTPRRPSTETPARVKGGGGGGGGDVGVAWKRTYAQKGGSPTSGEGDWRMHRRTYAVQSCGGGWHGRPLCLRRDKQVPQSGGFEHGSKASYQDRFAWEGTGPGGWHAWEGTRPSCARRAAAKGPRGTRHPRPAGAGNEASTTTAPRTPVAGNAAVTPPVGWGSVRRWGAAARTCVL